MEKGVKHVMTRVTAADPVSPVITVGCMWTQGFQDETTGQPCQTRGQLRGIESGHSGTPGVPYLIVPWCRWSHFLAIVHCLHCATARGGCTSNSGNGFPVTMLCPARQVSSGTKEAPPGLPLLAPLTAVPSELACFSLKCHSKHSKQTYLLGDSSTGQACLKYPILPSQFLESQAFARSY